MTLRLFGHWTCPFVNRVDFALAQRGIHHDLVPVPPSAVRPDDFVLPEEFVAHSPRLEVPMVCHEGDHLADSIPILLFLEDRFAASPLLPSADAAHITDRIHRLDEILMRAMGGVAYGADPAKIDRAAGRLADAFDEMESWLSDHAWLAGDDPSLAEAIAIPIYLRLDGLTALGYDRGLPARVADHRDRTMALPGGQHVAWSDAQADEYLGRHRKARSLRT